MASSSRNKRSVNIVDENAASVISDWLENWEEDADDEEKEEDFSSYVPNDVLSDNEDAEYIPSDHNTDSEESATSDVASDVDHETAVSDISHYYYGKNRFKWSSNPPTRNVRTPSHNILRLPSIRRNNNSEVLDPVDAFRLIFDDRMMEIILHWTNKKLEDIRNKNTNADKYMIRDTDVIELKGFISILIYTSVFKSNRESILSLYANDGSGRNIFRATIAMRRFLVLLVALRFDNFADREKRKRTDPACAITEMINLFVENSQKNYNPGANMTIDEMLIAFRGRCKFKMYMPSKPAKYGLKMQCLVDSKTFYVYNTYLYTGKDSDGHTLNSEERKASIPTQAVIRLCKPIYGSNRNITTDNWYSSLELLEALKNRGLTTVGTLKKNKREIPLAFLPQKDKVVDSSLFGFTKDCTLVSYVPKKNKAVILYSSMHHDNTIDTTTNKPEVIMEYNRTKGGVDAVDQKCSVYSCSRRTVRWPLAVMFRILDMCGTNAFVIYQSQKESVKLTRLKFLKNVARSLNETNLKTRMYNSRLPRNTRFIISEIIQEDLPNDVDETNEDKLPREQRKYCFLCPKKIKRKTAYICNACGKPICLSCSKKVCRQCAVRTTD
ncbi:piggyBac transposable element-derived protein 4-like [Vanessa atalanta]|uniref:piggyBac transposable element-derived protein 4-like n=1 Tax=Vanessa atalanta TaxID=42275 RepID=UPI001FCDCBC3|nr:piggyBac transposable element-derived protein 4-like [Vanessa atalanta]